MNKFRAALALLVGLVSLVVAGSPVAASGGSSSHNVHQTWKIRDASTKLRVSTFEQAGSASGRPFGHCHYTDHGRLVNDTESKGTFKLKCGHRGKVHGNYDVFFHSSTSPEYTGNGKFTSGTGKFRGAHGHFHMHGDTKLGPNGNEAMLKVRGSVKY